MFFSTNNMSFSSPSSLFSAYASLTASIMLFRSMANELIPSPIRNYLYSKLRLFFEPKTSTFIVIIEESDGLDRNIIYDAAEIYLRAKISSESNLKSLRISRSFKDKQVKFHLGNGVNIPDTYEGIDVKWCFKRTESSNNKGPPPGNYSSRDELQYFELSFHQKDKDTVLESYIPFILGHAKLVREKERILKMYTLNNSNGPGHWQSVKLEHPSTFDTLAMEPDQKRAVMEDLDRFLRRKELYKRVGRAWKRGYLLYGPPGTGKSSLVAAMANYLKFDVYDLQLANIMRDSDLRRLLLSTGNRSILVIEDIDCSVDLPDRHPASIPLNKKGTKQPELQRRQPEVQLTLSGLLNFIDGLWSSCGDERIIIFTTNHKDKLDPALLRPGRMDMHIHMSYCTFHGFKLLASNYLGVSNHPYLFGEIQNLIGNAKVTPAEVAEEFMKSEDANVVLEGVVELLKRKRTEDDDDEETDETQGSKAIKYPQVKRVKVDKKPRKSPRVNIGSIKKSRRKF